MSRDAASTSMPGDLDTGLTDEQEALRETAAGALARCRRSEHEQRRWNAGLDVAAWKVLGDIGVLGLGTPEGGGTVADICAALEVVGAHAIAGPVASTFYALQLDGLETREEIMGGEVVVARADGPGPVPWGAVAGTFVVCEGLDASIGQPVETLEVVDGLLGPTWGIGVIESGAPLGNGRAAFGVAACAVASYLVGAGLRLVNLASEYANDRTQFGRPIGAFQAVAHPVAEGHARMAAARAVANRAARHLDADPGGTDALRLAAAAYLCAGRAANDVAAKVHQVFGAMGYSAESEVPGLSAVIRHASLELSLSVAETVTLGRS